MISYDIALQKVLNNTMSLAETEIVTLDAALGRVLAMDVVSDMDMPPFDKSAVDGYACRRQDIYNELKIVEVVPAGKAPQYNVSENLCIKIMTGAMVPQGADCVLMVEHTEKTKEGHIRFLKSDTQNNIAYKAEDVKRGALVLQKGILLNPEHVAVLASVGCFEPQVSIMPRLSIISTGDELVEPYEVPGLSQIRNSNSWQLLAQAQQMKIKAVYGGIARDNEEVTYQMINKAAEENDVVLLTGGVSMGDYDFVPEMIKKTGFEILFRTMAIQPGKPTVFGMKGKKFCFGLPGNPVASFVIFELMVKPLLYKMMGHQFVPRILSLPFAHDFRRRAAERLSVIPVVVNREGFVTTIDYHGSAHIHALIGANGLAFIPIGKTTVGKGELVDVRLI